MKRVLSVGILSLLCPSRVHGIRHRHGSKFGVTDENATCAELVKGSMVRNSGWRRIHECKCPEGTVISGEHTICKQKWDTYDRYFDNDDPSFMALPEGACECKPRVLPDEHSLCGKLVKGSVERNSGWRRTNECKCPERTVISGEHAICKQKWDNYDRYFDNDDPSFMALSEGACECKHRTGCGMVAYDADEVLPKNAAKAGLPPPVVIGTRENIDTGVEEVDREFYGLWWMKDNPVPEELASMAGAFSRLSNKGPNGGDVSVEQVDWNLTVGVPNSRHNRWAWLDSWMARNIIMPTYTSADQRANNFTMYNTTDGEIETGLKTMPLIWVEAWYLKKIDDDTWLRTTKFQDGSLFSTNYYTLTRVVKEDGEPTKYFDTFKDYIAKNHSSAKLLVWDSDDSCKRSCMLAGKSCYYCHKCCTGTGECSYK